MSCLLTPTLLFRFIHCEARSNLHPPLSLSLSLLRLLASATARMSVVVAAWNSKKEGSPATVLYTTVGEAQSHRGSPSCLVPSLASPS